jgi:hypothetical protein
MYCFSKKAGVLLLTLILSFDGYASTVSSPDGKILVEFSLNNAGEPFYNVSYNRQTVLEKSALGLQTSDESFATNLRIVSEKEHRISEKYRLHSGKKSKHTAVCNQKEFVLKTAHNSEIRLQFRVYNEGAAFRYVLINSTETSTEIARELSAFNIPDNAVMWVSRYDSIGVYRPAYETYFTNAVSVNTKSPTLEGWAFPALFNTNQGWVLITEACLTDNYCASHLDGNNELGNFRIRFPESSEAMGQYSVNPVVTFPFFSPWRVIAIGSTCGEILQSSLVTHVSEPSKIENESWIKAGRSSWSWWSDHHSPRNFESLKHFVDLSASMGWEYSLVDANWDLMKGGNVNQLIDYAAGKNVGVWLWYNSGGKHNIVTERPRDILSDPGLRQQEFKKISKWGVKGIKVDFFQSDKQEIIKLYLDILRDAAANQLMVNFHGCTLPRGWERTYPNLMTMEGVVGAEVYCAWPEFPEKAPQHNTILPFTRNVVGPMDYTPVTFSNIEYAHLTTNAHELALSVVFQSGVQHFADRVSSYESLPADSKRLLQTIPVSWDETKYLDGVPGKYVVVARRKGKKWYVGGINGQAYPQEVTLNLSRLKLNHLVTDNTGLTPKSIKNHKGSITIKMDTYGGFVIY